MITQIEIEGNPQEKVKVTVRLDAVAKEIQTLNIMLRMQFIMKLMGDITKGDVLLLNDKQRVLMSDYIDRWNAIYLESTREDIEKYDENGELR
jgi:hypothetical protein